MRFSHASSRSSLKSTRSRNLRILDHAGQPVGAEQVHVARQRGFGFHVDLDVALQAERARDDVFRQARELFLAEVRIPRERVADERVIARELLHLVFADAVAAAVADVRDFNRAGAARHVHGDDRRTHALVLDPRARNLVHVGVGLAHAEDEAALGIAQRLVLLAQLAGDGPAHGRLEEILERRGGEGAGDLARVVAPHAVADDEEAELGLDQKLVLVVLALATDVGPSVCDGYDARPGRGVEHGPPLQDSHQHALEGAAL